MSDTVPRFATLGQRFLALVLDWILFCAVFFPVTRIVKGTWLMTSADHVWRIGWMISDPLCVIFFIVIVAYYVLLEAYLGWTVGKRLLDLRVIAVDGSKPGLKKSLIRNALRLVDGLPAFSILGVVVILLTKERTRLGDIVAGTRVVRNL
ncbi:MAG: RDD family protein [candidate division Zixibacteria bacterium]|nr:RDD family protein [candidate division Zixibacteria bacterium]